MSKMEETEDPPELDAADLNAFEVDSSMWLSSSDSSSQSGDLEDRAADVEDYLQKRRYSGSLKPKQMLGASAGAKTDLWKCRACGWTYPNHHPSARQKLEHKKHCGVLRDDAGLQDTHAGSDGSPDKQGAYQRYLGKFHFLTNHQCSRFMSTRYAICVSRMN
eukprot:TRINITY_DN11644_c0_g1_i1.p1 TRINITY_DN11644_c0_g1~~TRINITY_DN11644_c0_g1_i1.p1  ORF type:complete len:162 (+),score=15.45 TRINITY_DN11644_c0_g1_i1:105-590(+)